MQTGRFIRVLVFIIWLWPLSEIYSQNTADSIDRPPIDAKFLLNYYAQDGDHSAVTGGVGTQELTDLAGKIILNIPLDSMSRIKANLQVNRYSSASTDNIDFRMSSASSADTHLELGLDYSFEASENHTASVNGGGAMESDYYSGFLGGGYSVQSGDQNQRFSINANLFLDTWLLIFPYELRDTSHTNITTDKRRSISLRLQYDKVVNKRINASIVVEPVFQKGLLSTPFHRVYFMNEEDARIEFFPSERFKLPVAIRVNTFVGGMVILRSYYRFYWDNFGILSHTASLELPLKLSPVLSLSPLYRFYTQSAAEYFAPFEEHTSDSEYYTSDYDLSAFNSHQLGIGIRWIPLWGFHFRHSEPPISSPFKSVTMRYVYYKRSDGLSAHSVSSMFGFNF